MNSFYMIPNLLKDGDYAITNEIREYIESKGCRCTVAEKDSSGHILPGTVPDDVQCGLVLGRKWILTIIKRRWNPSFTKRRMWRNG